MYRTHRCGEISIQQKEKDVTLCGWVQTIRELGGITFVDLRDITGIVQIVFDQTPAPQPLGREDVLRIEGKVKKRKNENTHLPTGNVEVFVDSATLINKSKTPPFTIVEETDGGEELRMKYRFLDIRRPNIQHNLKLRHTLAQLIRTYLVDKNFLEIETPFLIGSTPEGARDFVIPSRMNRGLFYALPQSPQTFKQLLMVSGYDRYFQIVRCFRDEDLRSDRQPEFTQLDCEMSFVDEEDVMSLFEEMIAYLIKCVHKINIITPFLRLKWDVAIRDYGTDKPDIRFGAKIQNIKYNGETTIKAIKETSFKMFQQAESILGVIVPNKANSYSRKEIDTLSTWVKTSQVGMGGGSHISIKEGEVKSSFGKFFSQEQLRDIANSCNMKENDILFILAGKETITRKAAGNLRLHLAEKEEWIDKDTFSPLWITDFPLLEYQTETAGWGAVHHPFTSPKESDMEKLSQANLYGTIKAKAYDLVLNGAEIGGGSIRIHSRPIQEKVFNALSISDKEVKEKFGFLLSALEYGAPPHGGIAFGFDRLCAVIGGDYSIRDYIAFPKNNQGKDTMAGSPSALDRNQLEDLNLMSTNEK